jgi:hypothetical protein
MRCHSLWQGWNRSTAEQGRCANTATAHYGNLTGEGIDHSISVAWRCVKYLLGGSSSRLW